MLKRLWTALERLVNGVESLAESFEIANAEFRTKISAQEPAVENLLNSPINRIESRPTNGKRAKS